MRTFTTKDELRAAIIKYFDGTDNTDDIGTWDTSLITDMSDIFQDIPHISIEPITLNWNTKNVTNMSLMFHSCSQDFILHFDTSKVTNMYGMFCGANNFNQPLHFDTSKVTDMLGMFCGARNFNQPLNFNTSKVTNMSYMFNLATNFNQPLHFDTSKVTDMSFMFCEATNFNQPLYFNTSEVTHVYYMFYETTNPLYSNLSKMKQTFTVQQLAFYYNKLLLYYALNAINNKLPILIDL